MRFVIVTGMSGGGKSTTLKMLEDMGFYCVDNLPVSLLEKFAELIMQPGTELTKVALGLDVRNGQSFMELPKILDRLAEMNISVDVLYLDASEKALIRRYKETRRMHPLSPEGRVEDGVAKEREMLEKIKPYSKYVIDTTNLLTRELKAQLDEIFVKDKAYNNLMVSVMSFGFKHGIPVDADLVFDVRFLPNPFYIEELKTKTGLDEEVRNYVMQFDEAGIFLDKIVDLLQFLIPNYIKEGKYSLVVAIGCTGGKHRSVTLAGELYDRLEKQGGCGLKLYHRDVAVQGK
ncbi:MAG: RNase adapter RapZ [Lachnospiraceae bacterium]|nr:RNase adapter RapZ [Lachnospiraceae bacterium]MBR6303985.1 RNase adapter RapZ [Lachnospiraceae bacterium]MBR6909528.1 RNase adapter RapZ [Lachnospiraceae bacterium]